MSRCILFHSPRTPARPGRRAPRVVSVVLTATLVLACSLGSVARAQDAAVVADLTRYGRMSRQEARDVAARVHARMVENGRRGGTAYDPMRQALGVALFGGPGSNRAEYDERLRQVLERLRQGLTPSNLNSFFAPGQGVALRCAELFAVPIAACDAMTAAVSRQRADLPYLGPDDGAALAAELASAGIPPADSREIVRALSEMLLSVPGSLDSSERGRGIAELLRACPGGLVDRDAQVRAWHLGATSDLARCIGRTAGRAGRRAPQMIERVVGMNAPAGVVFLRWTHGQPIAAPAPRGPTRDEVLAQATAHYRAGRFAEAAQAYQQAVTLDPGFAPAHQGLAVSRLRAGDARGAADAYRAAARLDPRSAAIQVGLARALAQAGDREGAVLAYRMALTLEPGRPDAQRELAALAPPAPPPAPAPPPQPAGPSEADLRAQARAHYAARRFPQAEQGYRRLTELAPNEAGAHAGLGAALLAQGRANEAVVAYRRAVELDGRNAGFFVALGASYERSGNAAGARAAYERALSLDGTQRAAREGLARVAPAPPPSGSPGVAIAPSVTAPPGGPPPAPPPSGPTLPESPSRDDIVRTLGPLEARLEACAPRVDATVTFRLRIRGADGRVAEVETLGDMAATDEAGCWEGHLTGARFPRFTREEIEISYPFALRGAQADQPEAPPDVQPEG